MKRTKRNEKETKRNEKEWKETGKYWNCPKISLKDNFKLWSMLVYHLLKSQRSYLFHWECPELLWTGGERQFPYSVDPWLVFSYFALQFIFLSLNYYISVIFIILLLLSRTAECWRTNAIDFLLPQGSASVGRQWSRLTRKFSGTLGEKL